MAGCDPFYSIPYSRGNFDGFVAAGGQGTFETLGASSNGHWLIDAPDVWGPSVDAYLNAPPPR